VRRSERLAAEEVVSPRTEANKEILTRSCEVEHLGVMVSRYFHDESVVVLLEDGCLNTARGLLAFAKFRCFVVWRRKSSLTSQLKEIETNVDHEQNYIDE